MQPKDDEDRSQIVPSAAFYEAPRGLSTFKVLFSKLV